MCVLACFCVGSGWEWPSRLSSEVQRAAQKACGLFGEEPQGETSAWSCEHRSLCEERNQQICGFQTSFLVLPLHSIFQEWALANNWTTLGPDPKLIKSCKLVLKKSTFWSFIVCLKYLAAFLQEGDWTPVAQFFAEHADDTTRKRLRTQGQKRSWLEKKGFKIQKDIDIVARMQYFRWNSKTFPGFQSKNENNSYRAWTINDFNNTEI